MTHKKLVKLLVDSQVTILMLHYLKGRHPKMKRTLAMDILDAVIAGVTGEVVGRVASSFVKERK